MWGSYTKSNWNLYNYIWAGLVGESFPKIQKFVAYIYFHVETCSLYSISEAIIRSEAPKRVFLHVVNDTLHLPPPPHTVYSPPVITVSQSVTENQLTVVTGNIIKICRWKELLENWETLHSGDGRTTDEGRFGGLSIRGGTTAIRFLWNLKLRLFALEIPLLDLIASHMYSVHTL